jgi:tetratricopeptide (TPR) repeat protein
MSLLGQYQMRMRQYPAAIRTLRRAITLAPAQADAYLSLARVYQRQMDQAANGKVEALSAQAEAVLRQGISHVKGPNDQQAVRLVLAELLLEQGKADAALPVAQEALAQDPLNARAYTLVGEARMNRNDPDAAKENLETALLLDPNNSVILTQLGHLAAERGQDAVALSYYQKAYAADLSDVQAANALRTMIDETKLSVKRPPVYWRPTDDEYDYMIQVLNGLKRIQRIHARYVGDVHETFGDYRKEQFSLEGFQAIHRMVETLNRSFNAVNREYDAFSAIKPPTGMQSLHGKLLALQYDVLRFYKKDLEEDAILTDARMKQKDQEKMAILQDVANDQQVMAAQLNALAHRMPPALFQGLLAEAGVENTQALLQPLESPDIAMKSSREKKTAGESPQKSNAMNRPMVPAVQADKH